MKKLFTSFFAVFMIFCLTSCSSPMKNTEKRQNNLNCSFTSKALISLDKLNADATIKRFGDGMWEAEFESPNTLSGVKLTFMDGSVSADYKGLNFSVPRSALPVKAMLLNLIDAVDENARNEELKGSENEGMLEISGCLESGDYTLSVDENGYISSFAMPNNLLSITFSEVTPDSSYAPSTTEESSTAPAAETTEIASETVSAETTSAIS